MKLPVLNHLEKIQTNEMDKIIDTLTDDYFIVSLTMGHAYDRPILRSALKRNFKFVGVMGSDQKSKILRNELVNIDGLSINQIENLKCPIGESFGTNAPYEIGLSIVAQLIRIRDMQ
jgi:xanthine dehydrogenase accessory factor